MGSLTSPRRAAAVATAMVVLLGACEAGATDMVEPVVVLGATDDLSTSQSFTWRTAAASGSAPDLVVVGPVGPRATTRRIAAERKPSTTVEQTGSDAPSYTATVTDLEPGTTYEYRLETPAGSTPTRRFTTARDEIGSWSFLAFGDTQRDIDGVGADVVEAAVRAHPEAELVLHAGDLVDVPHRQAEWLAAMTALEPDRTTRPVVVARGNHERCVLVRDCRDPDGRAFAAWFTAPGSDPGKRARPWYRFDRQGVRFVVLDSFGDDLEAQAAFLEEALASNQQPWSVVLLHAGPFASRDKRTNTAVFAEWLPILERHDVDLVLAGHDHVYSRGYARTPDGPVYVTSNSGPKEYVLDDADWRRRGGTRVAAAERLSTYQVVDVSEERLRYRAVVAHRGRNPEPDLPIGAVLDEVVID